MFFALIACCTYCKNNPKTLRLPDHGDDRWLRPYVVAYGLANGVMSLSAYIAVKLAPISDVIVFCYTSLIFTIAFSACILRSRNSSVHCSPVIWGSIQLTN